MGDVGPVPDAPTPPSGEPLHDARYPMMWPPPSPPGCVNGVDDTDSDAPLECDATGGSILLGRVMTVIAIESGENSPSPSLLCAAYLQTYALPSVRPVTVTGDSVPVPVTVPPPPSNEQLAFQRSISCPCG